MKKYIIIGLAVATLGYLFMQDALKARKLIRRIPYTSETIMGDKDFHNSVIKAYTWSYVARTEYLRNASDIPLPFTEEEKTKWDETVNNMNNEIKTLEEKIEKTREETAEERNRLWDKSWELARKMREKEKEFVEKQNVALNKEYDEIREKLNAIEEQPRKMLENLDPKATKEELNLSWQKIYALVIKEMLPLEKRKQEIRHQRKMFEYDFKKTDEAKEIFNKRFEHAIAEAKVMQEEIVLRKDFKEKEKTAFSELYEIFKSARAKAPEAKLEFADEVARFRMIEEEIEEEIIEEKMEEDPLAVKKPTRRKRRRR